MVVFLCQPPNGLALSPDGDLRTDQPQLLRQNRLERSVLLFGECIISVISQDAVLGSAYFTYPAEGVPSAKLTPSGVDIERPEARTRSNSTEPIALIRVATVCS